MRYDKYNSEITQIIIDTKDIFLRNAPKNNIDIFLCGGASAAQAKYRYKLGDKIQKIKAKNTYNVYYPETLFAEITNGYHRRDLLTLENLLALSVTSIVVPLESPGTFAELGAFANHEILKDKLIIITKPKYKMARSFINDGPIAKVKLSKTSKILFYEMIDSNIDNISYKITEASRNMYSTFSGAPSLQNPLTAMVYYFVLIYVFDPINENEIVKIMDIEHQHDSEVISFQTALASLSSSGIVRMTKYPYYSVEKGGFDRFFSRYGYTHQEKKIIRDELEKVRIRAINTTYRKNRSWGEES